MNQHQHHNHENHNHNGHGHGHHNHQEHHCQMIEDFKKRFWWSLCLTIPVLLLSPMIQGWFGFSLGFPGADYVLTGLATVLFFYGGWPFLSGLSDELKKKQPGMMTLIALAITVAYVYSTATVFGISGQPFFWELATLVVVMLAGHWIEMKSVLNASGALEELMALMPDTAHRLNENGETEEVKVSELANGDRVQIRPGERIPSDGLIAEGSSYIDESVLTGESKPVQKGAGDEVIGGALNGKGALKVTVKTSQQDSYLSKVIHLVQEAQEKKSHTQHLADKAAFWLTVVAISAGAITLFSWLGAGFEFQFALERMVTVMVIACPHALGLAIPLVVAISTAVSAQNQLLIRNRTAFENSRKIDTIVFDKTGTLTLGNFGITRIGGTKEGYDEDTVLTFAAALEQTSEHPIATGIMQRAQEKGIKIPESSNVENMTGQGIQGEAEGKKVQLVSPGTLRAMGHTLPEGFEEQGAETLIFLVVNEEPVGYIALADQVRSTSKEAVKALQQMGIKVYMLTGDTEAVAKSVSEELNMDGYFAEVLPDQKQDKVKELQKEGKFVAMTGDGVNDAPALAQADVGIAVGSGTDVAAETADIILVESDPKDVLQLIRFGKATYKKMVENLFYASAYNIVALPLGAGVLYQWGVMIDPAVGAILMSLSTVAVAINAQMLKGKMKGGDGRLK